MQGLSKKEALADLRARIETLERRRPQDSVPPDVRSGGLAAPAGVLHEVFGDDQRVAAAALGFALGQARQLLGGPRRAVLVVQFGHEAQALGVPYGSGLAHFGLDPASLVLVRAETPVELLWAMEEAIGCRAVAAVIADLAMPMRSLDFTASRRLSLRAAESGSSAFILRYTREREASAARLRWHVRPAPSPPPAFDAQAPGQTRWRIALEKGRLGSRRDPVEWLVDWTSDGFLALDKAGGTAGPAADRPAFHGAASAALGNRLSEAG